MFSMLSSMLTGEDKAAISSNGSNTAEIIPGRLDFICVQDAVSPSGPATRDAVLFTVDRILNYEPFFADFGPLNLGQLYRFCQIVEDKLQSPEFKDRKLILYTSRGPQKKANAGYLIAAYLVLIRNLTPDEAWAKIEHISQGFIPFRDASMQVCTYKLTILHCLKALATATRLSWFNIGTFDIQQYEHLERIENGDLNVIIPNKFVHFSGPSNAHRDADGYPSKTPNDYIQTFKQLGVTDIIRLNKKCYDKTKFTKHGFQHHDMYFVDGTTPSMAILERFMSVCEQAKGMVAVHCKAGLGRTGTCVACYMMKFYRVSAAEAIAWLRICRPGSVLGPQQEFLEEMQPVMWRENDKLRRSASIVADKKNYTAYNLEKQLQNVKVSSDSDTKTSDESPKKNEEMESQGDQLVHRKFDAQHRKSDADIKFSSELDMAFSDLPRPTFHSDD